MPKLRLSFLLVTFLLATAGCSQKSNSSEPATPSTIVVQPASKLPPAEMSRYRRAQMRRHDEFKKLHQGDVAPAP